MSVIVLFIINILLLVYYLPKLIKLLFVQLPSYIGYKLMDDPACWSRRRRKLENDKLRRQKEIAKEKNEIIKRQLEQKRKNKIEEEKREIERKRDYNFVATYEYIMENIKNKDVITVFSDRILGEYRRIECYCKEKEYYVVLCYNTSNPQINVVYQTLDMLDSNSYLIKLDNILYDKEKWHWFMHVQKINNGELPKKDLDLIPYQFSALKQFYKPVNHVIDECLENIELNEYLNNIPTINRAANIDFGNSDNPFLS